MPIILPDGLPAIDNLNEKNVFVMNQKRSISQDIRPLEIALINLMPKKLETEEQFVRLLSNTPLQINLDLIATSSHDSKNTPKEHLTKFYNSIYDVMEKKYDGVIVTGAPIEKYTYEDVDYWDEMIEIMNFCKNNSHSTMYICWAGLAGLYHFYGINKVVKDKKIFGVFPHKLNSNKHEIVRGFDQIFNIPTSRYASIDRKEILKFNNLKIISENESTGPSIIVDSKNNDIYMMGHFEYELDTIHNEYLRDLNANENIVFPENYYLNDKKIKTSNIKPISWRAHANLIFSNWINYYVYQTVDYINK